MECEDWEVTLGRPWRCERAPLTWPWKCFPKEGEKTLALLVVPLRGELPWHYFCGSHVVCLFHARRQSTSRPPVNSAIAWEALIHEVWCSWTPRQCAELMVHLRCINQGWLFIFFSSSTQFGAFLHVFVQSNPFLSLPILISPDCSIIFPLLPLCSSCDLTCPLKKIIFFWSKKVEHAFIPILISLETFVCSTLPRVYITWIKWMRCSSIIY